MGSHLWKEVTINDLGKIVTGGTPTSKYPDLFGENYPFITPTDISDTHRSVMTERFLSESGRADQETRMLPGHATCFVCIGATIGKICMTDRPSFTNQQINSVIPNSDSYDCLYVYYLLSTKKEDIKNIAGGAATPIVSKSAFSTVKVRTPSLPIQRKIAAILSAYDDLIENNLRRIMILEEMAQAIYHEWFVRFRFPGHEKVKMVVSSLGKIPDGWEVKTIGSVIELAYGKALKEENRQRGIIPVYGSSGVVGYHNEPYSKGPGIIVGRKGNVGSIYWCDTDFWPIDTVFFVQTKLSLAYIYYDLLHQNFINNDAAVPGLNRNAAYMKPFLVPNDRMLEAFEKYITPIFSQLRTLQSKNTNLRQTRDLLLPKLISGEIDVEKMDIDVGGLGG